MGNDTSGMALLHQTDVTRAENTIRRLERDRSLLLRAMREIARPALGGKLQQQLAQAVLRELKDGE